MKYNRDMVGELREQKCAKQESKNIRMKICRLINQYHSIDNLEGTEEEKKDAKKRMRKYIFQECGNNRIFKEEVRMLLNDKLLWESKRDSFI